MPIAMFVLCNAAWNMQLYLQFLYIRLYVLYFHIRYINNMHAHTCLHLLCASVWVWLVSNVRAFAFCATAKVSFPFSAHLKTPPLSPTPPCQIRVKQNNMTQTAPNVNNFCQWQPQREQHGAIIMVGVMAVGRCSPIAKSPLFRQSQTN